MIICLTCHKEFKCRPSRIRNGRKYCSNKCKYQAQKTGNTVQCTKCKKVIYRTAYVQKDSESGKLFCSHSCRASYFNQFKEGKRHPNWLNGGGSYRSRALKRDGLKCANKEGCFLKDMIMPRYMYEVDHIDNNHSNNKLNNLQVLCVWCHREKTKNNILREGVVVARFALDEKILGPSPSSAAI